MDTSIPGKVRSATTRNRLSGSHPDERPEVAAVRGLGKWENLGRGLRSASVFAIAALGWAAIEPAHAQTVPPYVAGFEASESYTLGNVHGQNGWVVLQGAASVVSTVAFTGTQSVALTQNSGAARLSQAFGPQAGVTVTQVDFFTRPVATTDLAASTVVETESSSLGLLRVDTAGHVLAFDGDGSGGGRWILTGGVLALNSGGQATTWVRVTLRLDYSAHKWDLYIDGDMVASDLGFKDNNQTYFSLFRITAATAATGYLDDFFVGADHPLFVDADGDGMDDGWEATHGLNSGANDRNGDLDTDSLTNVEEFILGTNPNASDSDTDGIPDGWEISYALDPLVNDAADDPGEVGRTLLQSYQQSLSPWPTPVVANGLRAWYRSDKGVELNGTGQVVRWMDLSGQGFHVSGLADWVAGAMNGEGAVQFTAASTSVLKASRPVDVREGSTDLTVIAVAKPTAPQNGKANLVYLGDNNGGYFPYGIQGNASNLFKLEWAGGAGPVMTAEPGIVQVFSGVKTGTTATAFLNGVSMGSSTVTATIANPIGVLALGNGSYPYYGFKGQIAEVLVYNRALSVAEREQIEAALMAKYIDPDSDADGLPDAWEDQHLGTRSHGAPDDPGGVGRTLLQSYQQSLSPWPAPVVASGLRAWYRSDKGVQFNGTGQVVRWVDVSGQGLHASGLADWVSGAMNGEGAVQFTATSTSVLKASRPVDVRAGSNDLTIIAVAKPTAPQNGKANLVYLGDNNGGYFPYGIQGNASNLFKLEWAGGAGPVMTAEPGIVQVFSGVKAGTTATAFLNGVSMGSSTVTATIANPIGVLALGNGSYPYYGFKGQIAEVLVYNRALAAAEREQIEAALTAKYIDPDSDADGLPDAWEDQHLGTRSHGAADDPGAVGRTLLQSYEQSLSPWPTPVVASGLRAWYRSDKGVQLNGTGQVVRWTDLSGQGFHVSGLADWVSGAMNGEGAVQFTATSTSVLKALRPVDVRGGSDDLTIIAVAKPTAPQNGKANLVYLGDNNGGYFPYGIQGNASNVFKLEWTSGAGSAMAAEPDTVQVFSGVKNGTTATAFLNGESTGSTTVTAAISNSIGVLALGNGSYPYYGYKGQIAEVLVYNRALSVSEREQIEAALVGKYMTLDSDDDGLPDDWELTHFGTLGTGAGTDSDGDGVNNLAEFESGTSPIDYFNGRAFALTALSGGTSSVSYGYDASGRVTTALYGSSVQQQFAVDAAGNLSSVTTDDLPIVAWRLANNLPADGTGDGSDTAILAGDGLPNLAKYAFGLVPQIAESADHPRVSLTEIAGAYYLTIAYRRPASALTDLVYTVQVSSNGANWVSGSGATVAVGTSAAVGGIVEVTVRDATAVNNSNIGRRIRLAIARGLTP